MTRLVEQKVSEFYAQSIARPIPIDNGQKRVNGTHQAVVETPEDLAVMLEPTPLDRPFKALMELKSWGTVRVASDCTQAVAVAPEVMEQVPQDVLHAMQPATFYDFPLRINDKPIQEPSQTTYRVRNWNARSYYGGQYASLAGLEKEGYRYKVMKNSEEVRILTGKLRRSQRSR